MRSHTQKTELDPLRLCRQKSSPPFLRDFNISDRFGMQKGKKDPQDKNLDLTSPPLKKNTTPSQTHPTQVP